MWPITLSGRLPIVGLVGRYLTNYLIGREPTPNRIAPLTPVPCGSVVSCGIRTPFGILSPCLGQVAHALLTRPPLKHTRFHPKTSANVSPLDLHVLGTPPAFVLSQDQTLPFNPFKSAALAADPHSSESSVSLRFFLCSVSFSRFSRAPLSRSPARRLTILPNRRPFVNTFFESFLRFFHSFCYLELLAFSCFPMFAFLCVLLL